VVNYNSTHSFEYSLNPSTQSSSFEGQLYVPPLPREVSFSLQEKKHTLPLREVSTEYTNDWKYTKPTTGNLYERLKKNFYSFKEHLTDVCNVLKGYGKKTAIPRRSLAKIIGFISGISGAVVEGYFTSPILRINELPFRVIKVNGELYDVFDHRFLEWWESSLYPLANIRDPLFHVPVISWIWLTSMIVTGALAAYIGYHGSKKFLRKGKYEV
jgi:hypothetical protein